MFFPGCMRDDNAYRRGWYGGGWRNTFASPTGIYWGAFSARRFR